LNQTGNRQLLLFEEERRGDTVRIYRSAPYAEAADVIWKMQYMAEIVDPDRMILLTEEE